MTLCEHGLSSAYAGFEFGTGMQTITYDSDVVCNWFRKQWKLQLPAMIKTSDVPGDGKKITKVEILMKQERFREIKEGHERHRSNRYDSYTGSWMWYTEGCS